MKQNWLSTLALSLACLLPLSIAPSNAQEQTSLSQSTSAQSYESQTRGTDYPVTTLFTDVTQEAWYTKYIQRAYDAGLVSGKPDQSFDPDGELTFQEFAVMLTNAYYGKEVAVETYLFDSGVITGGWGTPYTNILRDAYGENQNYHAIVSALSDESKSTRYHASYLVGMLLTSEQVALSETHYVSVATTQFSDLSPSLNSTHQGLLGVAVEYGIMSGVGEGNFSGNDTLTRGQACVMISSLLDLSQQGVLLLDKASDTQWLEFRYDNYLAEHFEKHKEEFLFSNKEYYLVGANLVLYDQDVLARNQEDGDMCYYLEETNEFVVVSGDGYLRTYFKPDSGIDYFYRQ